MGTFFDGLSLFDPSSTPKVSVQCNAELFFAALEPSESGGVAAEYDAWLRPLSPWADIPLNEEAMKCIGITCINAHTPLCPMPMAMPTMMAHHFVDVHTLSHSSKPPVQELKVTFINLQSSLMLAVVRSIRLC